MAIGILGSALSGLAAFQRSLDVTSNNISNANTEGYSRQRTELQTSPEQYVGSGYLGSGVNVSNIKRSYDQFITGQVRASSSAFKEVDSFHSLSSQVDNVLADSNTSVSTAMKAFFDSVNDVANDPTSLAARQVLLAQGTTLTNQFNTLSTRFNELQRQVNSNLTQAVKDVNSYATSIAELNLQISDAIGKASAGQLPNELMDKRDVLLTKLAEKVDISVLNQEDGTVSVFVGQGQPLVMSGNTATLSQQDNGTDPYHPDLQINGVSVAKYLSGGEIYGNLRFRNEVLDPAQAQLGMLATGFATEFNNLHAAGYDTNGNTGVAFFDLGSPQALVIPHAKDSALVATASFSAPTSAANLGASYRLEVTGAGVFSLTNLTDNTTSGGLNAASLATLSAANGFSISFSGGSLNVGDSFEISPNFNVAGTIKVNPALTSASQIAAASAAGLTGDNGIALQLADLEQKTSMLGGKKTFTQVYGQLVSEVGSKTSSAAVGVSAQQVLLNQATEARENLAGVNLDEEAANLIKFQNAYQAAAKAVSVASSVFDTLINAV